MRSIWTLCAAFTISILMQAGSAYAQNLYAQNLVGNPDSTVTLGNTSTAMFHVFSYGNAAELLRVQSDGKVAVGAGTPQAKLDVFGNTLIRGLNTNTAPSVSAGLELFTGRSSTGDLASGQSSADVAFD